ncbi:MAG: OmpA family protein [Coxiellaceae bacterium]|nr:OmpA family protein [Coxiellaceae bacterium]
MKFNTLTMPAVIVACAFSLSACNMAGKNSSDTNAVASQTANAADAGGAQTYALNGKQAVDGQSGAVTADASDGSYPNMVKNSTRAPENQTYYFTFNSSGLKRQADMAAIVAQANYLVNNPNAKVRLEGNTDDRGSREFNIGLGWRRDQTIEDILLQHGVSKDQIKLVSYGKERPAVFGGNEAAWRLNRRVNLVYEAT